MNLLVPAIASFTAGYLTMNVLKWIFGNNNLFKNIRYVGRMKMALIVRTDIMNDKGKCASQCAQAAIFCYKKSLTEAPAVLRIWEASGQPKIVLKPDKNGEDVLLEYVKKAESLKLISSTVKNEENVVTVIGIGPGNPQDIDKVVGHLKLL